MRAFTENITKTTACRPTAITLNNATECLYGATAAKTIVETAEIVAPCSSRSLMVHGNDRRCNKLTGQHIKHYMLYNR